MGRSRKRSKAKPRGSHLYTIGLGSCTPGLASEDTEESCPSPNLTPTSIPNYDSWGRPTRFEMAGASIRVPSQWISRQSSVHMHQYAREHQLQLQSTEQEGTTTELYASSVPMANVLESQATLARPSVAKPKQGFSRQGRTENPQNVMNHEGAASLGLTHNVPNALNLGSDDSRFGQYDSSYANIRLDNTHMNMMPRHDMQHAEWRPQKISDWAKPDPYEGERVVGSSSNIWQSTTEPVNHDFMAHASPWLCSKPAQFTQMEHGSERRDLHKDWRQPSTPSPRDIQRSTRAGLRKDILGHPHEQY